MDKEPGRNSAGGMVAGVKREGIGPCRRVAISTTETKRNKDGRVGEGDRMGWEEKNRPAGLPELFGDDFTPSINQLSPLLSLLPLPVA